MIRSVLLPNETAFLHIVYLFYLLRRRRLFAVFRRRRLSLLVSHGFLSILSLII